MKREPRLRGPPTACSGGLTLMTNATLGALMPLPARLALVARPKTKIARSSKDSHFATSRNRRALLPSRGPSATTARFRTFVPAPFDPGPATLDRQQRASPKTFSRGNLHPIYNEQERAHYIAVGEIAYMREKQQLAIPYMLTHPARELHLSYLRFVSLWAGGAIHPIDDFFGTPDAWFRFVLSVNVFVALCTLAGVILLFAQRNAVRRFPLPRSH